MRLVAGAILLFWVCVGLAHTPPDDARVFFVNLKDGDVVGSPLHIQFGIEGFGVVPAGTKGKERHTAGHFHLLVDAEVLPDLDSPIPRSPNYIHYDQGQTGALLELSPGKHTLQLLLADEEHEPHAPPLMSEKITLTVEQR
jgi:hypothetical protein